MVVEPVFRGREFWTLLATSSFVDGYNLILAAPLVVLEGLRGGPLSPSLQSFLLIAAIAGNFAGGLLLGRLGDLLGRRRTFLWDLGFFVLLPVLCVLAPTVLILGILRFVLGIGIGGNYPLSSVLLAEHSDRANRGSRVARLGIFWTAGALASYLVGAGAYLLGPWGIPVLLLGAVPGAGIVMLLRRRLRESPLWEMARQRLDRERRNWPHPWAELTGRWQARRTAYALSFWFLFDVVQYGVSLFLPILIVVFGGIRGAAALGVSSLLYAGELGGTLLGAYGVDRWGRRPLQLGGFGAMTLALAAAAVLHGMITSTPALLGLLLLTVTVGVGTGPGILEFVYPPELFPTSVRATGSGLALSMSRLGAVVGILLGAVLGHSPVLFALYAIAGGLAFLITWWWAPETRGSDLGEPLGDAPRPVEGKPPARPLAG
jgi:putative MFS transporter